MRPTIAELQKVVDEFFWRVRPRGKPAVPSFWAVTKRENKGTIFYTHSHMYMMQTNIYIYIPILAQQRCNSCRIHDMNFDEISCIYIKINMIYIYMYIFSNGTSYSYCLAPPHTIPRVRFHGQDAGLVIEATGHSIWSSSTTSSCATRSGNAEPLHLCQCSSPHRLLAQIDGYFFKHICSYAYLTYSSYELSTCMYTKL